MESTTSSRVCAFCGRQGTADTRYAAGLGVLIDQECVEFFAAAMAHSGSDGRPGSDPHIPVRRHQVSELTDQDLLDALPRIASATGQVNRFLSEWVESIRERKMSWTTIGNAMGISRQAAWERFTRTAAGDRKSESR